MKTKLTLTVVARNVHVVVSLGVNVEHLLTVQIEYVPLVFVSHQCQLQLPLVVVVSFLMDVLQLAWQLARMHALFALIAVWRGANVHRLVPCGTVWNA